jgi:hypothetical protein
MDPRLAITHELSVNCLFLRVQVIVQDLVEAVQANTFCFFLFVVANLRAAPNALDHKSGFVFSSFVHSHQPYAAEVK